MLSAIHGVLSPHGYRIVVSSIGDAAASAARVLSSLDDGHVDGVIISPLRVDAQFIELLTATQVPVVAIGRSLRAHGIETVSTDSASGIGLAVTHLVDAGCRSLAFLNGPTDTTPGEHRQRGYDTAVAAPGFQAASFGTQVADDFTVAAGVEAAHVLLDRAVAAGVRLDAVVAANDLLAIGVVRAARERGLSVPDDLSVVAYDDEVADLFTPALTAVTPPRSSLGRAAVETLLARIADPSRPVHRTVLSPSFNSRLSTAPPRTS